VITEVFIAAVLSATTLANGVDGRCVVSASKVYNVPPSIILSIMSVEGGKVGMARKNKNKSYDLGPMQINDGVWMKKFNKFGITRSQLQYDGCTNVISGTWILKKRLIEAKKKNRSIWYGIGRYHSPGKTRAQIYRAVKYAERAERHHGRILRYYGKLKARFLAMDKKENISS